MKYVLTWWERPGGSCADHESAQERILAVFQQWQMQASLAIQQFLVRVGEFGGYAVLETDQPADIHRLTTVFAAFKFRQEPVLDVVEAAAIAWREGLAGRVGGVTRASAGQGSARLPLAKRQFDPVGVLWRNQNTEPVRSSSSLAGQTAHAAWAAGWRVPILADAGAIHGHPS